MASWPAVQTVTGGTVTGSTCAQAIATPVTGNALVVVSYAKAAVTVSSIAVSAGSASFAVVKAQANSTLPLEIWVAYGITSGATPTVTITYSGAPGAATKFTVYELSGLAGALDGTPHGATGTGNPLAGTLTLTADNDILISGANIASGTISAVPGPWIGTATGQTYVAALNSQAHASPAPGANYTQSGAGAYTAIIAAFKIATVAKQLVELFTGAATAHPAVFPGAQTAGNMNLVGVIIYSTTVGMAASNPVTDTKGNTYVQIGTTKVGTSNSLAVYYTTGGIIAATAGANTVTATTASSVDGAVIILEYQAPAGVSVDQSIFASGSSAGPASSGTMTTTANDHDLLVAITALTDKYVSSVDAGYTVEANTPQDNLYAAAQIVSAKGAYAVSPGLPSSVGWVTALIAFKLISLNGALQGKAANTGVLRATKPLAGSCTGAAGTNHGNLLQTNKLVVSAQAKAVFSGLLRASKPLAGSCAAAGANTGFLRATKLVAGTLQGRGASSGALSTASPLVGTLQGKAANTGVLTIKGPLAGTCTATGANTGFLRATKLLAGTLQGKAGVNHGNLLQTNKLVGTCQVRASITAALSETEVLFVVCSVRTVNTGLLRATKPLAGAVQGKAANTGALGQTNKVAGTVTAHTAITANLLQTNKIAGTEQGKAASSGLLRASKPLAGTITAQAANSAAITVQRPLAGTATAHAANSGNLTKALPFAGTCTASASSSGFLRATKPMTGSCQGHAAITGLLSGVNALNSAFLFHAAVTGLLRASKPLAVSCAAKAASSGTLSATHAVAGVCTVHAAITANLTKTIAVTGSCTVHSNSSGAISQTNKIAGSCQAKTVSSGLLRASKPLAGTVTAHTANSGNLVARRLLSGSCTVSGAISGALTLKVSLAGTCTVSTFGYGALNALQVAGTCTVQAASTGQVNVLKVLFGLCNPSMASSGLLRATKRAQGVCTVKAHGQGTLFASKRLSGTCAAKGASLPTLTVNRGLSGTLQGKAANIGNLILFRTSRLSGLATVQGSLQGSITTPSTAPPPSATLTGIGTLRGVGQAQIFIPAPVPVDLGNAPATVTIEAKGTLTNVNALVGTLTARSYSWGTFALPLLNMAATCTGQASSAGLLLLIANPVQYVSPVSGIYPLPLIADMEQMPIQMLIAYSQMYELPTAALQFSDLLANLKAIRWIFQGDGKMVQDSELRTLWSAYNLTPDPSRISSDAMSIILTRFLFNMPKRHAAWGFCKNVTTISQISGMMTNQIASGTCLIQMSITSAI